MAHAVLTREELFVLNQSPELRPCSPINTSPNAGMKLSCRTVAFFTQGPDLVLFTIQWHFFS